MTIELIKTKESDGDWYKIRVDGITKRCFGVFDDEPKAIAAAEKIFDWFLENNGEDYKVIKSAVI